MSLHKLTAGTGYTYLTRQVAAHDRTPGPRTSLASYYSEKGETPGRWVGSGVAGIDGLSVGDEVTAQQMRALFGAGLHPLAEQRRERLEGPDLSDRDFTAVTRLGVPFKVYTAEATAFQVEVAKRIEDHAASLGHPRDYPIDTAGPGEDPLPGRGRDVPRGARSGPARRPRAVRDDRETVPAEDHDGGRVRPDVLPGEVGQHPVGDRPTARSRRRSSWPTTRPSPTPWRSSRSTPCTRGRAPTGSARSTSPGLVAAAFTHRDSRAGDPDLHTHVAVANKVQTLSGKWLSHRRADPVQGQGHRLRDLQHRPGEAPAHPARAGLRRACRDRAGQAPGP